VLPRVGCIGSFDSGVVRLCYAIFGSFSLFSLFDVLEMHEFRL
jgi:hypothetical protein